LCQFPVDILANARALGQKIHELARGFVFHGRGSAGDEDFAVLTECVFEAVGDGVAGEAVVLFEAEGEGFEFGVAAAARLVAYASLGDESLG